MAVLLLFILIFNIVSIVLMYYCLGDIEKKEKIIFIAVGTGIMYILTSIVYWISTMRIEITEVSETGKNLITFLFVPVNGLIILPILAKSYVKLKYGNISNKVFANRILVLAVLLIIIFIIECNYFRQIQEQVINLIKNNTNIQQETDTNQLSDETNNNSLDNLDNQITEDVVNEVDTIIQKNTITETNIINGNENVVVVNTLEE